jgi:hypothetical protein
MLKGNVNDLRKLGARLNKFPTTVVHNVARKTAPALTQKANAAFSAARTVYGDTRPKGVDGRTLTLQRNPPATAATLRFVAIGTIVRCVLGTDYAKYLIGKYRILPMGEMPVSWSQQLKEYVEEEPFP